MNIHETFHFDKEGEVERFPLFRQYFLTILIILIVALAFGIGRLTGERRDGVKIITNDQGLTSSALLDAQPSDISASGPNSVVASSQGTKYYYADCKNTISEKNKVTFATSLMAEKAGYTLAANCKPR